MTTTAASLETATRETAARLAPATPGRAGSARLWLVELRKLVDTPSSIALLATCALLAGAFGGAATLFVDGVDFGYVARLAGVPLVTLIPVFSILLATSGRTHRTALTAYTLVPERGRVIGAQLLAVVSLSLVAGAATLAAAALITPVGALITGKEIPWSIEWPHHLVLVAGMVLAALSGYALGLATGLAPVAITIVLAWPALALLLSVFPVAAEITSWIDVNAVARLGDGATGGELARVASGFAAWILLPGAIGVARELRSEVK